MEPNLLTEYRCVCGKLLFKGFIPASVVEIKCKRCGKTKTFKDNTQGIRSFMLVVDGDGKIMDACNGVAALEYSRQYVIGKFISDILPLARDADAQSLLLNPNESKSYQIKNNTLLLRDREVPVESHIISINDDRSLYRIFNICRM